jgi:hypothetical protein
METGECRRRMKWRMKWEYESGNLGGDMDGMDVGEEERHHAGGGV